MFLKMANLDIKLRRVSKIYHEGVGIIYFNYILKKMSHVIKIALVN